MSPSSAHGQGCRRRGRKGTAALVCGCRGLLVCATEILTRGKSAVLAQAGCLLSPVSWAHCLPTLSPRTGAWNISGSSLCRVRTHARTPLGKQPAGGPATSLLRADPSPLSFQKPILAMRLSERHQSCSCQPWAGQGASPAHNLHPAQPSLQKAGCGPQAAGLSHRHSAQDHRNGSGQAQCQSLPNSPNIPEPGRTWYNSSIPLLSKIPFQRGCNISPTQKVA